MRLYDLWRDELTVVEVLGLIDQLPHWSRFVSALVDDDELLDGLSEENLKPARPALTSWTPEVNQLTQIYDRLGEVVRAVVGGYSKKVPTIKPAPRPQTAADRARLRRKRQQHDHVLSLVERARARARERGEM